MIMGVEPTAPIDLESDSAKSALKDELISETLGDVVKLRRQITSLEPLMAQAIERHAEIGQEMIKQQQAQFAAMAAGEIQKINASFTAEADKALSGASISLMAAAESLSSRESDRSAVVTSLIASGIGAVVGVAACVLLLVIFR